MMAVLVLVMVVGYKSPDRGYNYRYPTYNPT